MELVWRPCFEVAGVGEYVESLIVPVRRVRKQSNYS